MAITDSNLKIEIRGVLRSQKVMVVQWYEPQGAAFLTADAVGVGEAYWNHIKTAWRAMHAAIGLDFTKSIFVAEGTPGGAYGEYPIPVAEQEGTRDASGMNGFDVNFAAAGVRLTVGTRVTRPGQKRFWGLFDGDISGSDTLSATMTALVENVAQYFSAPIILGAPVALGVLQPLVVSILQEEGEPPVIVARQEVTGHLVHNQVSSQVSRKVR